MSTIPHRASFQYRLWNYRVISDFDLGDIAPASDHGLCEPLHIRLVSEKALAQPEGTALLEYRLRDGDLWFASWRSGEAYIARFPGFCTFRMQPDAMRIDCAPEPGVSASTVAHMILDHAIPRLLSLKPGYLVLHASSFLVDNEAIAVFGESGQGKSTLAAWLASHGFPLLTDDCLVLQKEVPQKEVPQEVVQHDPQTQQWLAQPSYHSVRLWPDSVDALGIDDTNLREFAGYSRKKRTGREVGLSFASQGAPLKACFVLAGPRGSASPAVRQLSVSESFIALIGAVFRLDAEDEHLNRREFDVLTTLTESIGFWSLSYERDYRQLPEVRNVMMEAFAATSALREGKTGRAR